MQEMTESVKQYGVLVPALVRPKPEGGYEMVAGHRRKKAAELAGLTEIPCIVRQLTDDEATIIMVDSNLQREQILPSEKAFAYKMKLDAMKRQGRRNGFNLSPVGPKLDTGGATWNSHKVGTVETQVSRFIRLTHLIPEILELVDNSVLKDPEMLQIALRPAVELSYLRKEEQADLFAIMDETGLYPVPRPGHQNASDVRSQDRRGTVSQGRAVVPLWRRKSPIKKNSSKSQRNGSTDILRRGRPRRRSRIPSSRRWSCIENANAV